MLPGVFGNRHVLTAGVLVFLGAHSFPAGATDIVLNGLAIGSGNVSVPVESWQEQKYRTTIHQEYDFSCGSAALATLLTYSYGIPSSEPDVFKGMFEHGDQAKIKQQGFSLLDMKKYLEAHNLPSAGFRAPLAKVAQAGAPGIVLINERGYRHFVVLRGIEDGRVLLADPSVGMRSESVYAFEQEWSGIFFAIITNVKVAQASYNRPQDWQTAPPPPLPIARYTIDLNTLEQQTTLPSSSFRF
jgi:uncharacterized protein